MKLPLSGQIGFTRLTRLENFDYERIRKKHTGCEILKCSMYHNGVCNSEEYVNEQGESICMRRDDAIHIDDFNKLQK